MLLLDTRGKNLLFGVCSSSGDLLFKQKSKCSTPIPSFLSQSLQTFDPSFIPFQISLTTTPGILSRITPALSFAKQFNCKLQPVHHLAAHLSFMHDPFLGLISTSTNTELLLFDGKNYQILGMDIDLPLGAAYSHLSYILNIQLSQFPLIENTEIIEYPQPMESQVGLDFSFSGSFNFTLQHIYPRVPQLTKRADLEDPCFFKENQEGMKVLAASFQKSVRNQVGGRVRKAIKWCKVHFPEIQVFALSGGVSRNSGIRDEVLESCEEAGWVMKWDNHADTVEMIRNCVFRYKRRPVDYSEIHAFENYPIGEYRFIDI